MALSVFVLFGLVGLVNGITPYPMPQQFDVLGVNSYQVSPTVEIVSSHAGDIWDAISSHYSAIFQAKTSGNSRYSGCPATAQIHEITVNISLSSETLDDTTDESYSYYIGVDKNQIPFAKIMSKTVYGARAALESLSQIVTEDAAATTLTMTCGNGAWIESAPVNVSDYPRYSYRGLMIDTSRHYLPVSLIRHIIHGMSVFRLNVLHWHITDSTSFPVKSEKFPQLAEKGAFSETAIYNLTDLKNIVQYGKVRGVRIVPEFDMPGHGSWWMGMPELNLSSCEDVFNPTHPKLYSFLTEFLNEMGTVFEDPLLMLGGDEVGFDPKCQWPGSPVCGYHCFDKDPSVASWMAQHQLNSSQLLDYFWTQVTAQVAPNLIGKTLGVWMADTPNGAGGPLRVWPAPKMSTLPRSAIANIYQTMETAIPILNAGYKTVLSIASSEWYLDYHPDFNTIYKVRPCQQLNCQDHPSWKNLLLGGEVCMWGTFASKENFDANVWEGVAAVAERLWTDGNHTSQDAMSRYQSLACHWSLAGGIQTFQREALGKLNTEIIGVDPTCPSAWVEIDY
eukprot:m.117984 g.117984  ORF g.117984 m.117984 type:complete len:562 (-) comp14267_c0_seq2:2181-3866(-)